MSDNAERDTRKEKYNKDMGSKYPSRSRGRPFFKKKVCKICTGRYKLNYREVSVLKRFTSERGKILPRRITGTCAKHQRQVARSIKRARVLALLPFTAK